MQFVPYRDFKHGATQDSSERLAAAVLAEIPQQLLGFMASRSILPGGWAASQATPAVATAAATLMNGGLAVDGSVLVRTASEAQRIVAARRETEAAEQAMGAMEAQLLGVRSEIAALSGSAQTLHEGLCAVQVGKQPEHGQAMMVAGILVVWRTSQTTDLLIVPFSDWWQ
eukprot:SAG11_NODE_27_length_23309_cov_10.579362_14_plen_170_part_00